MIKILVVEDVEHLRELMKSQLETLGYRVDEAADLETAIRKTRMGTYDIFVLDLVLPDGNGIQLLDKFPEKTVSRTIIVTANPTIPSVVEAVKKGAYNYLEKPVDTELLKNQVEKIMEICRLKSEHRAMATEMASNFTFDDIVYQSKQMESVIARAKILAGTTNTILIQGETGCGKEVFSHAMHNFSARKEKVFLPLNCAAIPEELFESELFGFEKGAFTGATSNYSGRFFQADKGTLFLDEIGELPLTIQAKLLRILDERCIYRLKSREPVTVDVWLITASNRDLLQEIKVKQFRSDLYYRLQESTITIPPLRKREEDILPLFRHFVQVYSRVFGKEVSHISREAEHLLLGHRWEGNVRELK
ncbi:MAG: sigma-54-dependent Fis family transcriptional regulator, partial [bacterium]|nr:sigma-54-dependent Fis family transcriptional regulator [bacterium]